MRPASARTIRPVFAAGALLHLAGLPLYDRTPLPYLASIPVLAAGYYLFLRDAGVRPLASGTFWAMVAVLSIPVAGPVAGAQRMRMLLRPESPDLRGRLRTTVRTLLLLVPLAALCAALLRPSLRGGSPGIPVGLFVAAAAAEAFLAAALVLLKRKPAHADPEGADG